MAIDRQGTGLALLRICIGIFFIFEGIGKIRWFTDTSLLAAQFARLGAGGAGRLVEPLRIWSAWRCRSVRRSRGSSRSARSPRAWRSSPASGRPSSRFVAFFMALNFQFASGALFKYAFFTSGYGLPVLGSTLALALGGVRLPWSLGGSRPARSMKVKGS